MLETGVYAEGDPTNQSTTDIRTTTIPIYLLRLQNKLHKRYRDKYNLGLNGDRSGQNEQPELTK